MHRRALCGGRGDEDLRALLLDARPKPGDLPVGRLLEVGADALEFLVAQRRPGLPQEEREQLRAVRQQPEVLHIAQGAEQARAPPAEECRPQRHHLDGVGQVRRLVPVAGPQRRQPRPVRLARTGEAPGDRRDVRVLAVVRRRRGEALGQRARARAPQRQLVAHVQSQTPLPDSAAFVALTTPASSAGPVDAPGAGALVTLTAAYL